MEINQHLAHRSHTSLGRPPTGWHTPQRRPTRRRGWPARARAMRREPQMTGSGPGRRLRRLAVAAAAAVLLAAVGQAAAAAPVQAGVSRTSITVDRAHPFSRLPADFVGLSYEMRELASWCTTGDCTGNFDARTGNLVALYKNLGKSNVRIGGNQLDRDTLWLPAGQQAPNPLPDWVKDIVTPADIARFD